MKIVGLSATPSTVTAAVVAVRQHPCWSQALQDCVYGKASSAVPDCALIRAGYAADAKTVDAAVEALPFCPEPERAPWMIWGAAAAFGFVVGAFVGSSLRKP
jgi:hypothetical protein